jgi:hypothetical protein
MSILGNTRSKRNSCRASLAGSARNCSDGTGCTVDSCNEGANSCQSCPDDDRVDDDDDADGDVR